MRLNDIVQEGILTITFFHDCISQVLLKVSRKLLTPVYIGKVKHDFNELLELLIIVRPCIREVNKLMTYYETLSQLKGLIGIEKFPLRVH